MKNEDIQKVTLNLRAGDYERLGHLFPDLRAGPAIRQIISNFIDKAERAVQGEAPDVDVQL